jgi:hypothetical protein
VLGRIGSGSTVAGVGVGCVAVALSEDQRFLTWLFACLTVVVMAVTLAPWIPLVKNWLPSTRRRKQLEGYWAEGHELAYEPADTHEWRDYKARTAGWASKVHDWLKANISPLEAEMFKQPTDVSYKRAHSGTFSDSISARRELMRAQLAVLRRIRDDQLPK